MTPAEWTAHTARYRPPDTSEQVRTAAAKHVPADQLDSIMAVVDPAKFLGDNGEVDEARVARNFGTLFGTEQRPRQWGQRTGQPAGARTGETARAAIAKRYGAKVDPPAPIQHPGDTARAAHAKRHGVNNIR